MEFKVRLKELRKARGVTQKDLGKTLGYKYTAISNYENGRNEPNIEGLKKIADYFCVSLDYLMGNEKNLDSRSIEYLIQENYELKQYIKEIERITADTNKRLL